MAVDLFYFLSTLPTLRLGQKPPFTYQEFLEKCQADLAPELAAAALAAHLVPHVEAEDRVSPTADAWYDFETFLRNTVAAVRMTKLPRGNLLFPKVVSDYLSPSDRKAIEDAMAQPTPAEREAALDRIRWRFLDGLEACHSFDQPLLEIYALRLQLLGKQNSRTLEAGRDAFRELLENGIRQARQNRVDAES